ncbi:FAD-binding oxidoreductase [Panacibacter ginsenosidivorans]|uniref:FAD-binding oxidoreductase n=1 Tax=Panacibacter ginsenosidivorans TaxID=1813871 RepID=UPI001CEF764D|nr:FAD-binding oxidoreductase [Panacibacter ginsenosidivorans]
MKNLPVIEKLIEALGEQKVLSSEKAAERIANVYGKARSLDVRALVLPASTNDVAVTLKICNEYKQAVVPQGGLSNVVNSATANKNEIAISLEKMNAIKEVDRINQFVEVEAGVILEQLHEKVKESGFIFPLDLGAKGSCMIGGNIATNAGGLQALRYGVMRNLVLGLEVVLADGTILNNLNPVLKNNTGYDLKHLFIGSEGTLGIITRAILKLTPAPAFFSTAFIALENFDNSKELLNRAKIFFGDKLTSFEILWPAFYKLLTNENSGNKKVIADNYPLYVLTEIAGAAALESQMEIFLETVLNDNIIVDAVLAQRQEDRKQFWQIREKIDQILIRHNPVFTFDVSLPVSEMEQYVITVDATLKENFDTFYNYAFGHMGDGNLHLMINCGEENTDAKELVEKIVYAPLQSIPSSVSAEHGIGLSKKKWLSFSRSPEEIAVMRSIKNLLDPNNIMNPGKIF